MYPGQSSIELQKYLCGFEDTIITELFSRSQFTIVLGHLNIRSSTWWSNDIIEYDTQL